MSASCCCCCCQVKPRPHQQQCRSNIVKCYKLNDSVDKVEYCFHIVAVFGNNVQQNFVLSTELLLFSLFWLCRKEEISFDIVTKNGNKVERCFNIFAKNGNIVEATFEFVGRNFTINPFDIVAVLATKSNVVSTKSNIALTFLLVWMGLITCSCRARIKAATPFPEQSGGR